MGDILTDSDYDYIRDMYGLTNTELPDALFDNPMIYPFVELQVKRVVTDWETIKDNAGDNWDLLRTATMYVLAVALYNNVYTYLDRGGSSSLLEYSYSEPAVEWENMLEEWRKKGMQAFDYITTQVRGRWTLAVIDGPGLTTKKTASYNYLFQLTVPTVMWASNEDSPGDTF